MKPKMFIGCSTEGLPVANALQVNLDYDADITIWNQGIFELTANTLSDLETIVKTVNFAIFILAPDDVIFSRSKKSPAARDNVIFETGLFIGYLGSNKVYLLRPRNKMLNLPSDLLGITIGTYNEERENLIAAVGSFCTQVRNMIKRYYGEGLSPFNNQNIIENTVHYDIKILNNDGDAIISITQSITPLKRTLAFRKHEIFCDASSMKMDEIKLSAWDSNKNKLLIKIDRDNPNRKQFTIHLKEAVARNETIIYTFSYTWKKMFPSKDEYFKLKKTAAHSSFCLSYPKAWAMHYLKAEYDDNDNENNDPLILSGTRTKIQGAFKVYKCTLEEIEMNSSIILSWNRS